MDLNPGAFDEHPRPVSPQRGRAGAPHHVAIGSPLPSPKPPVGEAVSSVADEQQRFSTEPISDLLGHRPGAGRADPIIVEANYVGQYPIPERAAVGCDQLSLVQV
ncbi:hypothetical protein A5724_13060 [Mycobacterium sp. ACS1612]|nr:hypothetical protein A5724_13060 [Mycobacterium sp. ACS1612]